MISCNDCMVLRFCKASCDTCRGCTKDYKHIYLLQAPCNERRACLLSALREQPIMTPVSEHTLYGTEDVLRSAPVVCRCVYRGMLLMLLYNALPHSR